MLPGIGARKQGSEKQNHKRVRKQESKLVEIKQVTKQQSKKVNSNNARDTNKPSKKAK